MATGRAFPETLRTLPTARRGVALQRRPDSGPSARQNARVNEAAVQKGARQNVLPHFAAVSIVSALGRLWPLRVESRHCVCQHPIMDPDRLTVELAASPLTPDS